MNLTAHPVAGSAPDAAGQKAKIQQSAKQFEAQLLNSLLGPLEASFGTVPGSEESGPGEQYRSLAAQSLASAWADAGGVGIARILVRALTRASATGIVGVPAGLPPAGWRELKSAP